MERPPVDPLVGQLLGDYRVEAPIGRGGMGVVYRAVHPLIGRRVAVKTLLPELAEDPEQAARFLKEAQALSAVKHRGVIDVISFGKLPDGRQYMVMEFLEGEALDAALHREGSFSPVRALTLIDEVLDALSAAHRAGVVHRDIKPANVFLLTQSNGTTVVKLVDFGLARHSGVGGLTRAGAKTSLMAGTPEYFSPEQARGLAATPRSDLYAVGVMSFELLSGQLPFKDTGITELLDAHQRKPAPRLSSVAGGIPDAVDAFVASLLEKDPERRPASADIARATVQRLLRELKAEATHVGPRPGAVGASQSLTARLPDTRPAGLRLSRLAVAATLSTAVLVGVLAWAGLRPGGPAPATVAPRRVLPAPSAPSPVGRVEEDVPPEAPPKVDDLSPLAVNQPRPSSRPARPRPPSPPAFCAAAGWKDTLREKVGEAQQRARAAGVLTPAAEDGLRTIHQQARDSTKDCATLARELESWRAQHLP
ncbi:MAG: serine/threonine protein kinase [Myxococcaceae bacterium]|nr:serine/threonine protein kinase [Myxococcaceae bacterium]